jgi:hypothetical protein
MLIKNLEHSQGKQALLPLFLTLLFAMSFWPARAQGQIVGNLEANIPFQFHVGNTSLPAGRYIIRELEGNDLTVMQISSADGKQSALFDVESVQAKTTPGKSELIFNKYGDRYFLSEMFDEGNVDGNRLFTSRDEKRAGKESGAEVAYVVAEHPQQQGN